MSAAFPSDKKTFRISFPINYTITANSSEIVAEIDGSILVINSVEDWNGISQLIVKASDGINPDFSDQFLITVTPKNGSPVITGLPSNFTMVEVVVSVGGLA